MVSNLPIVEPLKSALLSLNLLLCKIPCCGKAHDYTLLHVTMRLWWECQLSYFLRMCMYLLNAGQYISLDKLFEYGL